MTGHARRVLLAAAVGAVLVTSLLAGQAPASGDDLRGAVRSPAGPEAGVWVIAETDDLDTGFRKIVVTDDEGRFLVPDLPDASYRVWVRGYGLVDSEPVTAGPGQTPTLDAAPAGSPQAAARVYPANYWYSLLEPPAAGEFPGTGPAGNGIARGLQSQARWVDVTKQGCQLCHQMGNRFTFDMGHLDGFDSSAEAWAHRLTFGQRGRQMSGVLNRFGRERGLAMFADWS
ncbi:MAG: carboxypeptidase-like regulatory domain-containing protein, partial [Acidobacteria bacterium]|nr:carboxypeptidase-like regulatory domain-containing protein [Acidobacteriota bacterium]